MQAVERQPSFFTGTTPAIARPGPAICSIVIDAEEDFDWDTPIQGTSSSTSHMKNISVLNGILGAYGAVPTYLLTYPVLEDAEALLVLRRQLEKGQCAVGVQLHSWVTPPFDDMPAQQHSFAGNLDPNQEERKLVALKRKFRHCFGHEPIVYRAGRYGISRQTSLLLEKHGFEIDTSVAPHTSFRAAGGPDYSRHDPRPFWFGARRRLLEVPLCRGIVGWAGGMAPALYRGGSSPALSGLHALSILTRSRCAERITLSPEGNDVAAMRRLVHGLQAQGQQVFTLSFHSSSLQAGRNPYVRSKADLHWFYDRMSATLDHLATRLAFRFAGIADIPALLMPPGLPQAVPAAAPSRASARAAQETTPV